MSTASHPKRAKDTRIASRRANPGWRDDALRVLNGAGLVALPTETVYGLAGDASSDKAVAAIYVAKGRPSRNPLIAHVSDLTMANRFADLNAEAIKLAQAFWPGPLTIVAPLAEQAKLADAMTAGGNSVALRAPRGALGELVASFGRPIAAPSANRSGHVSPTTAQHVQRDLDGLIDLIIDDGPCPMGLESTIVDLRAKQPVLLRPGALNEADITDVLGKKLSTNSEKEPSKPVAPGMLSSHYAPLAPVRINIEPRDVIAGETYLGFGLAHLDGHPNLSVDGDLAEAAHKLFAALRAADEGGATSIAIAPIPQQGLGTALNDRLRRAAAPR